MCLNSVQTDGCSPKPYRPFLIGLVELFYDLLFVANLTEFTHNHPITGSGTNFEKKVSVNSHGDTQPYAHTNRFVYTVDP